MTPALVLSPSSDITPSSNNSVFAAFTGAISSVLIWKSLNITNVFINLLMSLSPLLPLHYFSVLGVHTAGRTQEHPRSSGSGQHGIQLTKEEGCKGGLNTKWGREKKLKP